ncbi:hypothetical protein [Desulfobacter latus]|uniref:Uncharacterized protein n=1 Tax=Desulfobacter latus TaxID=2292 RepID=A0A850T5W4_9BACT|nr:hypothetical protein [Desulfobacter latus]NWH03708.1 hypothetical protein [Desulfobacter latus]
MDGKDLSSWAFLGCSARKLAEEYGATLPDGTKFYVDSNRFDDCGDGKSWDTAKKTIAAALAMTKPNDIVEISGGRSGKKYQTNINTTAAFRIIRGSEEAGHDGLVTIDASSADDTGYYGKHKGTLENVDIIGTQTGRDCLRLTASHRFNKVRCYNASRGLSCTTSAASVFIFNRCEFSALAEQAVILGSAIPGSAVFVFNYCLFENNTFDAATIIVRSASSITFNNCSFVGNASKILNVAVGDTVITFNNPIIAANAGRKSDTKVITKELGFNGRITLNHPIILPSAKSCADDYTWDVDILKGGYTTKAPGWLSSRREGITSVIIDDYNNFSHWKDIADYATIKGVGTVLGIHAPDTVSVENYAEMATYVAAGHEIACHSRNHSILTTESGGLNAIDVTCTGTNPTIEITLDTSDDNSDNWYGTVVLREDGVLAGNKISITGTTSIGSLVARIKAQGGPTWNGTALNTNATGPTLAKCLLKGTFSVPSTLQFNQENYWYVEIAEAKTLIEAGIGGGYECRSWISPGNHTSRALRQYLMDDTTLFPGHFAKAGTTPFRLARSGTGGSRDLSAINLAMVDSPNLRDTLGSISANFERNTNAVGVYMAYEGIYSAAYAHGIDEITLQEWKDFIDRTLAITGMSIVTLGGLYDRITGSGLWTDDGDFMWSRVFSDDWQDMVRCDSVAVDGGGFVPALYGEEDPWGINWGDQLNIGRDQGADN